MESPEPQRHRRPSLLAALIGRGSATFELYLGGPRAELVEVLSQMGTLRPGGDRIAFKWAGALASMGPQGAVISLPTDASEDDARALFGALGAEVRRRAWSLADASGGHISSQVDALFDKFREAGLTALPSKPRQRAPLNHSQRYAVFLVVVVVVGLIFVAVLRSVLQSFLANAFGGG